MARFVTLVYGAIALVLLVASVVRMNAWVALLGLGWVLLAGWFAREWYRERGGV